MMKVLKQFCQAWRLSQRQVEASGAADWTEADADSLLAFLRTVPGQKLVATLRNLTFADVHGAVSSPPGLLNWRCGHAAGMQSMAGHLDMLSHWKAGVTEKAAGPTDDLTWLYGRNISDITTEA